MCGASLGGIGRRSARGRLSVSTRASGATPNRSSQRTCGSSVESAREAADHRECTGVARLTSRRKRLPRSPEDLAAPAANVLRLQVPADEKVDEGVRSVVGSALLMVVNLVLVSQIGDSTDH
jgi:hypothetical protein